MNGNQYWKDRLPFLFANALCMILLPLFLLLVGNRLDTILLILAVWVLILAAGLIWSYHSRKQKLDRLLNLAEHLEERYLLSEMLPEPKCFEDQVYFRLIKLSSKSMLERIDTVKRERREYKEYIEQWIHEIKTPITAMNLLCENNRTPFTGELLTELEQINRFTEQTLYYARSEHTEKDYSIREIYLQDVIHQAIADNKHLLLQHQVAVEVASSDVMVYSDDKWIRFIINQLIVNAVKYGSEHPALYFYTKTGGDQVLLYVEDNGIGIPPGDLPRIFEKGFTGQNGRTRQNATGFGLYLCKRLCSKLGIGITAASEGNGTTVVLTFQMNHFIHQVQG